MQEKKEQKLRENLLNEFKESDTRASDLHGSDVMNKKINSFESANKIERIRSIV